MANTYTQLYVHLIFATHRRIALLQPEERQEMQRYISGIIRNRGHKLLSIHFMPDHAHLLINLQPGMALSNLVRDIKAISAKHINEQKWIPDKFQWQNGYGAFSYAYSQLDDVIHYIEHQEEHHKQTTFEEEYRAFLKKFRISFDDQHLYDFAE